jgi:hypothetical protein
LPNLKILRTKTNTNRSVDKPYCPQAKPTA